MFNFIVGLVIGVVFCVPLAKYAGIAKTAVVNYFNK